jgi:hypothetical protein
MTGKHILPYATAVLALLPAALTGMPASAQEQDEGFSYADYAKALEQYVDEQGMVDYRGLKNNRGPLDAYVRELAGLQRAEYEDWTDPQKIAFWINAYNGLTLRVIIDNYPIQPTFPARLRFPNNSIRQIRGVWDGIEFSVMGREMTLDDIEHEVLRKEFDEPRIHLALVCAAMGCPPLLNEPYRAEKLGEQFADRTRLFLQNAEKFRIDRQKDRVQLSPIFDWFGKDFIGQYGTDTRFRGHGRKERAVLNYLSRFLDERDRAYLENGDYKVKYLDYDWSLNEQEETDMQ